MKYKDYYNFELGNRDIYSHNDILGMTVKDLFDNELPLSYQYNTIGIPKDDELIASPNTHQYTNANGKLRWRSSSKTTEELLGEERQRNQAMQAQTQAMQSRLGTMAGNAAPVSGITEETTPAAALDDSPMIEDKTIQALGNLAGKAISKLKNGKKEDTLTSPISEAVEKEVNSPEQVEPESPISKAIEQEIQGNETPTLLGMQMPEENKELDSKQGLLGKLGDSIKNLGGGIKDGVANLNSNPRYQKVKDGIQKTAQEYLKLQNGGGQQRKSNVPSMEDIFKKKGDLAPVNQPWDDGIAKRPIIIQEAEHQAEPMYFRDPNKDIAYPQESQNTTLRNDPMWEELKNAIQNQPSDEELEAQEAAIQAQNDAILDRVYGADSREIQGKSNGIATGEAAGIGDAQAVAPYLYKAGLLKQNEGNINGSNTLKQQNEMKKTPLEKVGQFMFETVLNSKYPMASNATIDGMHDFKAARSQKRVRVMSDLNSIENDKYKSYLKSIGANDNTPGVVYDEHSDVSFTMSNSPELEAHLVKIRDKVIKGEQLKDFDLYYDVSLKDFDIRKSPDKDDRVSRMATFRNVKCVDPKVDDNGVFTCKMLDYSDFANEPIKRLQDIPNKWGYEMQRKGFYKPYYQIVNIRKKVNW